jgi:tRNA-dihydrouridine synthase
MGFAGVDINMGCPDRAVVRSGGGSGLIENPDLAVAIIQAVKSSFGRRGPVARSTPENLFARSKKFSGVAPPRATPSAKVGSLPVFTGDHSVVLPVSVKTRLGVRDVSEWREWIGVLLGQDLAALTIHLRTRKEMSKVPAHYELIPEILELRDAVAPGTRIIINGDVTGRAMARELAERYPGVDGWMVGRGVFANPFCFESEEGSHTREELVGLLRYHLDLFDEAGAGRKFAPLKRFFKIYINGFAGAGAVRERLMETQNTDEARAVLDEYFSR